MTNTINNVPRELLADLLGNDHDKRIMAERHLLAMLANAPSPAGVDGLEVVAWRIGFPNNAGYKVYEQRQPWAYEQYGVPSVIVYEVQELCHLSAAQAIIDGLRGEVAKINSDRLACWAEFKVMTRACLDAEKERDQQAQRIGELEGLLREIGNRCEQRDMPGEQIIAEWSDQIDAALYSR